MLNEGTGFRKSHCKEERGNAPHRRCARKLTFYFYPRDDTPGCTQEARDFSALEPKFAAGAPASSALQRTMVQAMRVSSPSSGLAFPSRRTTARSARRSERGWNKAYTGANIWASIGRRS